MQGLYESGLVGIVNLDTADSVWKCAAAVSTCEGGDLVLAICEKMLGEVASDAARSLRMRVNFPNLANLRGKALEDWVLLTPTMATFSIRLVKPAGWSLAYLGDIVKYCIQSV